DPGVLQLQRLDLGAHHHPVHRVSGTEHLLGTWVQPDVIGEVRVQPAPETLRLADVDHAAVRDTEPVHPGSVRDGSEGGSITRRIGNVSEPNRGLVYNHGACRSAHQDDTDSKTYSCSINNNAVVPGRVPSYASGTDQGKYA